MCPPGRSFTLRLAGWASSVAPTSRASTVRPGRGPRLCVLPIGSTLSARLGGPPLGILSGGCPKCVLLEGSLPNLRGLHYTLRLKGLQHVSCREGLLFVSCREDLLMCPAGTSFMYLASRASTCILLRGLIIRITSQRGLPQLNWKGLQYDSCRKDLLYVSYRKVKGHLI